MKKFLGLILAVVMLVTATSAFAQDRRNALSVNGNEIEREYILAEDGTVMIPLRAVCEELGFEVEWVEEARTIELTKGAIFITCSPDFDGYAFSKMAHQPLGKAPMLVGGTTYVPVDFIWEILGGRVYPQEYPYGILVPDDPAAASVYATEYENGVLKVVDFNMGEVIVKISETTEICDMEGTPVKPEDIVDKGMQLEVRYGSAMTLSLPPQTTAEKIVVTNEIAKIVKEGTVSEIIKDEEGKVTQLILGENEVALNVADETAVKDADGNTKALADITVGTQLRARTNGMATRSIPAQMPALEIMIF